ncbi:MAG: hypothetical protein RMN25_00825 [Anaerolineae bacterium]|nr:hypothetical protein [Thermoflexales bacterium]MDW8406299.1 hypothetical protein [Anaerolineae bacterium]
MPPAPRLLMIVLMWFCMENAVRAALAVQQVVEWAELPTALPPDYVAASGIVWSILFAVNALVAWLRPQRVVSISLIIMTLYQAHLWLNRLAFGRSSETAETLGFRAILTIASFIGLTIGLLAAKRRAYRPEHQGGSPNTAH